MTTPRKQLYLRKKMAYKHRYDKKGDAFEAGESAENSFEVALTKGSWSFRPASLQEQFSHIDYWVWKAGMQETPIDVKARKKIKRKDSATNDSFIWVEFTSVNGSKGWLYGKSEFIAFETEDNFLIVRRSALAALCERICNVKELNQHGNKPPLYVGYQRYGRKDLVSLIKLEDILNNLPHSFILK